MANEKKPSIYHDRGTIGSAKELDEYGVWVKSEPQDLTTEGAGTGDQDFSLDGLDDLPDFSTDLAASAGLNSASEDADFSLPDDDFSIPDDDAGQDFSLDNVDFSLSEESSPEEDEGPEFSEEPPTESPEAPEAEEGFTEISLEDLLGDVADEVPEEAGPESPENAGAAGSADISTQLLMKIADELSSIRTELSTLKQEFTSIRGNAAPDQTEAHGFFDNAEDDKIALTGDELNNILNTADFTEEAGADAAAEDLSVPEESSASEDLSLPEEFSVTEDLTLPEEPGASDELSLPEEPALSEELSLPEEFSVTEDLSLPEEPGASDELSLPEEPALSEDLSLSEDLNLSEDLSVLEEPSASEELSLPEEPSLSEDLSLPEEFSVTEDLSLPEEPALSEDLGLPEEFSLSEDLGSLEEDGAADLSLEPEAGEQTEEAVSTDPVGDELLNELELPGEESLPLVDLSEITLEETPSIEISDEPDLDISLDAADPALTEEENIALEGFDEGALDLTGAVIDEPDLGAEIQENPVLEPDDIVDLDAGLVDDIAPAAASNPVDDVEDETEIAKSEESAAEIPAVRGNASRGEDLDQIIPDGFIVEDLDEELPEGFGGAGLDTLEEGISLDEIPEDMLPEDEAPVSLGNIETVEEPEINGIPAGNFRQELKNVLSYMDQLLESLPENKIEEFARSEYFDTYKKLFKDLGLA